MKHDFFYDGYGNKVYVDVDGEIAEALVQAQASGAFDGPPGPQGEQGEKGEKGNTGDTGPAGTTDFNALQNKPTTETWTFTLEDGSTVEKAVYVG